MRNEMILKKKKKIIKSVLLTDNRVLGSETDKSNQIIFFYSNQVFRN